MLSKPGSPACLALALIAGGLMAPTAFGQGNTFNPYGNSGYRDYREFTQPMYSNEPSLPGQARLQREGSGGGGSRANQFDAYTDSLENREAEASGSSTFRSAPGVPYFRAYRQYDKEYDRVYKPNEKADREFANRLKGRTTAYDEAAKEKDPARRAALLRQLNQNSLDRPLPPTRGTAKGSVAAKSARPGAVSSIPTPPSSRNPQTRSDATRPATRPAASGTAPATIPTPSSTANRSLGAGRPLPALGAANPTPAATPPVGPSDPGAVPIPPPR